MNNIKRIIPNLFVILFFMVFVSAILFDVIDKPLNYCVRSAAEQCVFSGYFIRHFWSFVIVIVAFYLAYVTEAVGKIDNDN